MEAVDAMSGVREKVSDWLWPSGAPTVLPAENEIQVWGASLTRSPEHLAELAAMLAEDERQRAAAFRFPVHRDRFIAGRGLLRALLGVYLERLPGLLRLETGSHGKPCLADPEAAVGLQFNVSHSGAGVLYAISRRDVGVDLETHERDLEFAALIERVCTPREIAQFKSYPVAWQKQRFFACWTRKEASTKASGRGLAGGARAWEVCLTESSPPENRIALRDAEGQPWSVLTLPLVSGWSGALAARGWEWWWRGWCLPDTFLGPNRG
ncbi:MAG: 4'-phosphopantetheinyl transferase superfamily protein [Candidatus Competibacter denitrificans]|jgi:4'-phosphopantetheinyl transferase